jgi:hypothetical protein
MSSISLSQMAKHTDNESIESSAVEKSKLSCWNQND